MGSVTAAENDQVFSQSSHLMVEAGFWEVSMGQVGAEGPAKSLLDLSQDVQVATGISILELASKHESALKL